MLLQANDYVELNQRYGCSLQVGGSDQWGNIIAGVRLVRQKAGRSVHALTTPLVTDSEGKKFGKSTGGGNLWLDPEMTSPYAWYQYFVNTADADVIGYLRWFTFLSAEEIAELDQATAERAHERAAQRRLAQELTTLVHGEARRLPSSWPARRSSVAAICRTRRTDAGRGADGGCGGRTHAGRSRRHRRSAGGHGTLSR